MRLPPLNALRVFEAAARHGSFARAADELCVTHVAVSRQIRLLEERLGVELFKRRHRGVTLTAKGEEYREALAQAFDHIVAATHRLTGERLRERLKIETDSAFAARWLAPRLGRWRAANPGLDVEIVPWRQAGGPPVPGTVDAVIHYGTVDWPGMHVDRLITIDGFPVCSPKLLKGRPPLKSPSDLKTMTLLHEESTHYWRGWLVAVGASDVDWSKGPIFHETTVVQEAVVRGEGVALGDSVLWAELLDDGRAIRLFDTAIEYDAYDLLVPHSALGDPAVAAFRNWLLDEAKQG